MFSRLRVLFVLLLLPTALAFAQDPPDAIDLAIADLSERLDEPLTQESFTSWSWSEEIYNDSSLGCPQDGEMYAQVVSRAYQFVFTYDEITYDYRVAKDGSAVILCSSSSAQSEATEEAPIASNRITPETTTLVTPLSQRVIEQQIIAVMDWSPTGKMLAIAGSDAEGSVWLFDMSNPAAEPERFAIDESVMALEFAQVSSQVFLTVGGLDGTVRYFQVEPRGLDVMVMASQNQSIADLAVSPDGVIIAGASASPTAETDTPNNVFLWNTRTGELLTTLEHDVPVDSVAFSPDGRLLATGDLDGNVNLWKLTFNITETAVTISAERSTVLEGHMDTIRDLAFTPDGAILASGSMDGTTRLWSIADESAYAILDAEGNDAVLSLDFGANGRVLATAGGNPNAENVTNDISLWDVQTGSLLTTLQGHETTIGTVVFSPDGQFIASVSDDNIVRLWGISPDARG